MKTFILAGALLLVWLGSTTQAQNVYTGNPADGDMLESVFSNPALNVFSRNRAALALTSHQTGVAGKLFAIRSGIVTYNLPWQARGAALGVQFMQAGLYSQNDFRVSYGRRFLRILSLGANLDLFNRSFDREKFVLFDANDPVFRNGTSKWGASLGLGAAIVPHHAFVLGVSLEHLNRPNLAMNGSYAQPMLLSAGVKVYAGAVNLFSSVSGLEFFDYSGSLLGSTSNMLAHKTMLGVEIPVMGYGDLRLALGARAFQAEMEAFLFKNVYFNYRFEYPLTAINAASTGTHRFGFLFDMERQPPLPILQPLPDLPVFHADVKAKSASPRGQFVIFTEDDTVNVTQRRVHRKVDDDVPRYTLGLLFPEDLGAMQGLTFESPRRLLSGMEVRDPTILPRELYATRYRGALEGIGFKMKSAHAPTEMITYAGAERRGNALVNLMTGNRIAITQEVPMFAPDSLPMTLQKVESLLSLGEEVQRVIIPGKSTLKIVPLYRANYTGKWWLEVRTSRDSTVYAGAGEGLPPDTLTWNWTISSGDVIPPGIYYFTLRSLNLQNEPEESDRGYFTVVHRHLATNIAISREAKVSDIDADGYIIILGGKTQANHSGNNGEKQDQTKQKQLSEE